MRSAAGSKGSGLLDPFGNTDLGSNRIETTAADDTAFYHARDNGIYRVPLP